MITIKTLGWARACSGGLDVDEDSTDQRREQQANIKERNVQGRFGGGGGGAG